MDQVKIGKLIAECRKKKHLTQEQLAEKLGVSNKSVSKWENGKCLPDVSLYKELCNILGITLNDFFAGEIIEEKNYKRIADNNLEKLIKAKNKLKKIFQISIITFIVVIILMFFGILSSNKTFFKTTYIGEQNQEIFIPRFSYFEKECCMTAATFYSLKSKIQLENEIKNYLKDFTYFSDESTYGYKKDDLFIQTYEVEEHIIYRKIIIVY